MKKKTRKTVEDKPDVSIFIYIFRLSYLLFVPFTVLRLIRKLCDACIYPTSLELLRVHLAATVFSEEVQDLLDHYKQEVKSALNIRDVDPLLVYLRHFWELLQLNNSKKPITWTPDKGLDDIVVGNGTFTIHFISNLYGVSLSHLETITGLSRNDPIPQGMEVRFNRPDRWIAISKWFSDWEEWVNSLPNLTKVQRSRMFITHQLHGDLQRTCNSMYDIIHEYVKGNVRRKWIPKRFSQDPLESFFSEIRQSGGGSTDSCRETVDRMTQKLRFDHMNR